MLEFFSLPVIWFIVFSVLLVVEILTGLFFCLLMSISAIVVFFLSLIPVFSNDAISFSIQVMIFCILSMILFFVFKNKIKSIFKTSKENEFQGEVVTCLTEFNNDGGFRGKVEFKGSQWDAKSMCFLKSGDNAKILSNESILLIIDKV